MIKHHKTIHFCVGARHRVSHLFEPEVQQQENQVSDRRHGAAGDTARGRTDPPCRR